MPRCCPSRAAALTTARASPALLISASSSSARNAPLPAAVPPAPLMVVATPDPFDRCQRSIVDRRRAAWEAVTTE